jgi:hypothetical protein
MNKKIFRLLIPLLALTGMACQYNDNLTRARAPQLYWPGTKAYEKYTSYFRLDEDEARQRLKSLGLHDYPSPFLVVGDWYLNGARPLPKDPQYSFGGEFVNGITGAVESRVYRGEAVPRRKQPQEELRWEKVEKLAPPMTPAELARLKPRPPGTPQIYWKWTKTYESHTSQFRLTEHEAYEILDSRGIWAFRVHAAIGDWYFLRVTLSKDPTLPLSGYYVNGVTGAAEHRDYPGPPLRYGTQPLEEMRWEKVKTIAPPMTPAELTRYKARLAVPPQVAWKGTPAYEDRISHFRLTPEQAERRLKRLGQRGERVQSVIGDWYDFGDTSWDEPESFIAGHFVNGITGAVENRHGRPWPQVRYGKQPSEILQWETVEAIAPALTPEELSKLKARPAKTP